MAGDTIGSAVIEISADASGVSAGIAQATQAVKGFEQAATGAGAKAGAALSKANRDTSLTSSQLTREQERLISTINNYSNTVGKSRGEVLEFRAAQAGITSQVQAQIAAIKSQEAALRSGGAALKTYGVSAGQTAAAFRQLPAQLTDVVTQLAGGQSPFLILLQQGGQVKDSFGGIGAAARALGSLITPTTVAIGGLAAGFGALAVGIAHAESMVRSLNTLQAQLTATGRANEFSTGELKAFINTLALAPGVTRDSATAIVSELSKVHQIGGELFRNLSKIAVDYAKATGTDVPTAARTLAQSFADPEKGAKALDAALGTLTSSQLLQIETMTRQNDLVGAQRVLFEALESSVKGLATNALTPLQAATNDLGNAWEKAMQQIDKTQGFQNATSAATILLGRITQLVNYLPEFEKKWSSAFSGGLNGLVMRGLGIGGSAPKAGGPQTGGATGSWDPAPAAADPREAEIKRALEAAKAFQSEAGQIKGLRQERSKFTAALASSIAAYGKESEQAARFRDAIAGIDERIKAAEKRGAGPKPKAYQDDAATKYLMQLRETEASLKEQLTQNEKLTASQRELARFEQQIADIKEKKVLTADQKSLLANQAQIEAQLKKNVEIENEVKAREKATKEAEKQKKLADDFARTIQGINISIESSSQSRSEQQERSLAAFGLGDRARQQVEAQRSIRAEYERYQRQLTKDAAEKNQLGSDAYLEEVDKIKAALDQQLANLQNYFDREKALREDWRTGASTALANYIDEIDNASQRAQGLVTNTLGGITDGLTNTIMGDKGSSWKDIGKRIAEQITRGIVEQQITKPIAEWLQGSLKDGDSLIGKLLGGLTSNKGTGENWLGFLGLGGSKSGGGAGAGTGLASVATTSNTAATSLVSLAEAANQASFSLGGAGGGLGGGGGGGLLDSLFTGIAGAFGGLSNGAATSLANASGTGLDGLFRYTNNFAGRAFGGPANAGSMYEVAENAPELLTVGNKTMLMMGKESGNVVPLRQAGGRGDTYVTNVSVEGRVERQTRSQIANETSLAQRRARRLA